MGSLPERTLFFCLLIASFFFQILKSEFIYGSSISLSEYMNRLEKIDQKTGDSQGVFALLESNILRTYPTKIQSQKHRKIVKNFLFDAVRTGELLCLYILSSYDSALVIENYNDLKNIAEEKKYKDIKSLLNLHYNFYSYFFRVDYEKAVEEFLFRYRIDQKLPNGSTLFYLALVKGHSKFAKLLLKKGASVKLKNTFGQKALHLSVETKDRDLVQDIYEKDPSAIMETDSFGKKPLFYSVQVQQKAKDFQEQEKSREVMVFLTEKMERT